ncbi:hypothetical protein K488DRAFT_85922 [Vararia minispora EC-137]|uniref:Uncharacterized protein n=1 Tax=Vararia minispora EC-137 TaxID=1314806 RepID=A0ACB8QKL5_9AGAM|nr:hypothetical protein K488DRAFT_85922 [Vararia minispora EC-137]
MATPPSPVDPILPLQDHALQHIPAVSYIADLHALRSPPKARTSPHTRSYSALSNNFSLNITYPPFWEDELPRRPLNRPSYALHLARSPISHVRSTVTWSIKCLPRAPITIGQTTPILLPNQPDLILVLLTDARAESSLTVSVQINLLHPPLHLDASVLPSNGDRLLLPNEAISRRPWLTCTYQLLIWPFSNFPYSLTHPPPARSLPALQCPSLRRAYDRLEARRDKRVMTPLETPAEYDTEHDHMDLSRLHIATSHPHPTTTVP